MKGLLERTLKTTAITIATLGFVYNSQATSDPVDFKAYSPQQTIKLSYESKLSRMVEDKKPIPEEKQDPNIFFNKYGILSKKEDLEGLENSDENDNNTNKTFKNNNFKTPGIHLKMMKK